MRTRPVDPNCKECVGTVFYTKGNGTAAAMLDSSTERGSEAMITCAKCGSKVGVTGPCKTCARGIKTMKNDQVDAETLGRCDFKQYEHCGVHERIPDVGQRFPPFGCKNWKVNAEKNSAVPSAETKPTPELKATPSYCADCRVNTVSTYPSSVELCPFHAAAPALYEAAQTVLDGLNARIKAASDAKQPVPVFDEIADLHSALALARGDVPEEEIKGTNDEG